MELVIRRLDSISILPAVAVQLYSRLLQPQFSLPSIADIIELDPVLTAATLSLINKQDVDAFGEKFSLRQAIEKLPRDIIRDILWGPQTRKSAFGEPLFSVKVLGMFPSEDRTVIRKELALHSIAVACCAKDLAEITSPKVNPQVVHCAGLLHDIGKLALEEAMPKSFANIVEQAKSTGADACTVEQELLGLDHTIIGKRLAQKWRLPNLITLAVWLHHSDTVKITLRMPEAKIAQVVQLANSIVGQSGPGWPGGFDSLSPAAEQIARSLEISLEPLNHIRQGLPEKVRQKSELLGLDMPNAVATYCDIVHATAARLAREQTEISLENQKLKTASRHFDFIKDFVLSIDSTDGAIDMAENFAVRWQKFYQTGMVCLYLVPQDKFQPIEAVVVENLSKTKMVYLDVPTGTPAIPKVIARDFAVLDAHDYTGWLFGQLDVEFDLNRTKLMPLLAGGRAIGAIVFELRYPADVELFLEKFRTSASVAGSFLDMACACQKQQRFAEQFAQHLAKTVEIQPPSITDTSLEVLVEMAAGAAHELNNPLAVISGRAQLLNETETDQQKKQVLKQIQENAGKISGMIEELMSIARPSEPRPTETNIEQLLDEAVQLTRQKTGAEHINIQMDLDQDVKNVFVDSAQIVSAIANVLSNAVESYADSLGPIKVTAASEQNGSFVRLQISDLGCGMDAETLQKATRPFFSARPAGRKRGMGLAYTYRAIRLNKGSLNIKSRPGAGTTVTIMLPCKY
jgi:putative nucleotidyltransferase with HDIG domain